MSGYFGTGFSRDPVGDLLKDQVFSALFDEEAEHGQVTGFALVNEVKFERIVPAVDRVFTRAVKMNLQQEKDFVSEPEFVPARVVYLYGVAVIDKPSWGGSGNKANGSTQICGLKAHPCDPFGSGQIDG